MSPRPLRCTLRLVVTGERVFRQADPYDHGAAPGSSVFALIGFVGLCLLVGVVNGLACARGAGSWYAALPVPPGTLPDWLFAAVWAVLYVMIGCAAWLVWRQVHVWSGALAPLRLWGWQLLLNALWPSAQFVLQSPGLGLAVILPDLVLIGLTMRAFLPASRTGALLMVPYALWMCYEAFLDAGTWWLAGA